MAIIKTIRQLIGYLIFLTLIIDPYQVYTAATNATLTWHNAVDFVGVYYVACAFFALFGNTYALNQWYTVDVLAATLIHGTRERTISGITGQYMDSKKRYYYQAKVIDWLAELFGDEPNHCHRAYLWELNSGYVL